MGITPFINESLSFSRSFASILTLNNIIFKAFQMDVLYPFVHHLLSFFFHL